MALSEKTGHRPQPAVTVGFQLSNLAHIVQTDNAGQISGAFDNNTVIKHFVLDILEYYPVNLCFLIQ